jgi:hypothetical protein
MTPQEIISDEEIVRVHGNANFGAMDPREVVNDGVRKTAVGYHCGSTQLHILRDHGLVTKPRPGSSDTDLTKKGKAYARSIYRHTTPARAEAQDEGAAELAAGLRGMARECMETMDEAQADVLIRSAVALEAAYRTPRADEGAADTLAHRVYRHLTNYAEVCAARRENIEKVRDAAFAAMTRAHPSPPDEDRVRIAVEALEEIAAIEPKPFEGGLDAAAIRACEECKRYEGHPVQLGICDTHRRPIWEREKHDSHEEKALGYRAKSISRDALAALKSTAAKEGGK